MRVELLWWDGCPSHPRALEELCWVLREEGVDADVELVEVRSDDEARRLRFPGSPTIVIDGRDVLAPAAGEPFTLTCRVYRLRNGSVSPVPDTEDLRDAVRLALRSAA